MMNDAAVSTVDILTSEKDVQIMQEQNRRLLTIGWIVFCICCSAGWIMFFAIGTENFWGLVGGTIASTGLAAMGFGISKVMFKR